VKIYEKLEKFNTPFNRKNSSYDVIRGDRHFFGI